MQHSKEWCTVYIVNYSVYSTTHFPFLKYNCYLGRWLICATSLLLPSYKIILDLALLNSPPLFKFCIYFPRLSYLLCTYVEHDLFTPVTDFPPYYSVGDNSNAIFNHSKNIILYHHANMIYDYASIIHNQAHFERSTSHTAARSLEHAL